jgi:hypothetical protein
MDEAVDGIEVVRGTRDRESSFAATILQLLQLLLELCNLLMIESIYAHRFL